MKWGAFEVTARDVLVSHPEIYPGVPIVGRPGIRLPYVNCFGLHYQMMADKTVITMMPGTRWSIPNEELIEVLTRQSRQNRQNPRRDRARYEKQLLDFGPATQPGRQGAPILFPVLRRRQRISTTLGRQTCPPTWEICAQCSCLDAGHACLSRWQIASAHRWKRSPRASTLPG